MAYFPIFIELEKKRVLIAGGGTVAFRKARVLREYGAVLTIVAPELDEALKEWAASQGPEVTVFNRKAELTDVDPADLLILATNDSRLQRYLSRYAKDKKIPVNTADEGKDGTFLFPAVARRGSVVAGITTGGKCPAASHYLRTEIQKLLTERLEFTVDFVGASREKIRRQFPDQKKRREIFNEMFRRGMGQE